MQPAVARTGGACGWATANGAALPPPSQAALARAASVLAAPAAPVRSLSESLVGTGLMLVRMRAVCAPHSALTGQPVARAMRAHRVSDRAACSCIPTKGWSRCTALCHCATAVKQTRKARLCAHPVGPYCCYAAAVLGERLAAGVPCCA